MNVFRATPCQNHPEREALGICIQCRSQVCSECVTKVDGINYCVRCLASMSADNSRVRADSSQMPPQVVWMLVLVFGSLLTLMLWGMLYVALPGAR